MLSPVFHPNIAPHAICVGDHWGAGESLQSIVARIGEMLAFQSYNVKSPLNGEAARWVEENKHRLPLDGVSLLVEEREAPSNGAAPGPMKPAASSAPLATPAAAPTSNGAHPTLSHSAGSPTASAVAAIACPACGSDYRIAVEMMGRKVRCKKCQRVFEVMASPASGNPES
jgi:predicted Zn finger-like uncharacterized protein